MDLFMDHKQAYRHGIRLVQAYYEAIMSNDDATYKNACAALMRALISGDNDEKLGAIFAYPVINDSLADLNLEPYFMLPALKTIMWNSNEHIVIRLSAYSAVSRVAKDDSLEMLNLIQITLISDILMAQTAYQEALEDAGYTIEDIDYVNDKNRYDVAVEEGFDQDEIRTWLTPTSISSFVENELDMDGLD